MLALSLAILGGVDSDPHGTALHPAPVAQIEAAPSYRLDVGVLRFDAGARAASDFGTALYDLDGALDAGARLGDDNLSLAFTGALALEHTRGPFVVVDGAPLVAPSTGTVLDVTGSLAPRASLGARFHLDMDDVETALAWTGALASVHDARGLAFTSGADVTRLVRAGDVVASDASHRVDADLRLALRTLTDDRALRSDLEGASALMVGGAAHHAFALPNAPDAPGAPPSNADTRILAWGGLGFAWDGTYFDASAWAGPALDVAPDDVATKVGGDIAGALELALDLASDRASDERRTAIARLERRPFASPFHERAVLSGGSLAFSSTLAFLEVGASASGAFIDVDGGDDGLRGDALLEARWALELVTLVARVTAEACVFGAVGLARGALLVGLEL